MRINPGDLSARVQFQRAGPSDDGFSNVPVFADYGTPKRARKRDISDGERVRGGEIVAQGTSRFVVRRSDFTAGITAKDQIVCADVVYSIVHIKALDDGRRWLEITASARVDG